METLIERIKKQHCYSPPPTETEFLIQQFEASQTYQLSVDMKEFYRFCGSADLFDGDYVIMPLSEICRISLAQVGEDSEEWCPASWYAFCDIRDGNYIGIDLASFDGSNCDILHCEHESIGEATIIAKSFSEFLLHTLNSKDEPYWFEKSFEPYGYIEYETPMYFLQKRAVEWYERESEKAEQDERPEKCQHEGCNRKRISLSVMCLRHHYEMITGVKIPIED